MNCKVCDEEIDECAGLYLIGGDLCDEHYWQENQDSPFFPLSGFDNRRT
ncbi:hypothetical protein J2755_000279 [Methanohalophilus levihalophilus]|nr:hypothetical protein [Methanohalophilus levihalophilus]